MGYCEQPIQPIGYAIAGDGVHLRRCADEKVCVVAIQISRVGESQLQAAIQDLDATLEGLYGAATNLDAADAECASALSSGHYACLLYGNARFIRRRSITGGAVELRVEGADGAESALIAITLATSEGWQAVTERDL